METVVAVPLPPPNQAEMDELRMQSVERAAMTSSHLNQMYEQLAQFHAQQKAMAKRMEDESSLQFAMAKAMEKNRLEQEESRAILLRQQELVRQQNELKRAMAKQARVSEAHQEMLRQASDAIRHHNYKVEDLNQKVQELDLDSVAKAMTSLKMDTKIRDAESRVGRLLADFYDKLEQLDVAHLPEQEPKQLVAMDPKPEPNRPRQYGEKPRRQLPPKKADCGAQARALAMTATSAPYARGCLKCGSEVHKVMKCPKCQPGEAQRILDQRFKKPHVATVAAPDKETDKKTKFIGAAVAANDVVEARAYRTLDCDINRLKATTLLDSGADQSLDDAMELGGFMKGMKLDVDRDVKLRLTFDTAEGTLVIASLKCWVAVATLQDGLGDLIVSRDVMAKLGYCHRSDVLNARRAQSVYDLDQLGGKDTPLMAAMKVVEAMEKLPSSPEEASLYPEEEQACFPQVTPDWSKENDQAVVRPKLKDKVSE
ncbi:hypothetical protein DYB31_014304, partial [Aphanomyces astaci]